jgi:glutamate-1-semialdehyde 2,1-aminomutase
VNFHMRNLSKSKALLEESRKYLAGGVPSGVQSAFAPHPIFVDHGQGSHFYDVDGNAYLDYVLGFGPLILGHAPCVLTQAITDQLERGTVFGSPNEAIITLSRLICEILPSAELVQFNNSGSEAVQGALRAARAFTGREKIIKFEGHYHGWLDNVYVSHSPDSLSLMGMSNAPRPLLCSAGQVSSVVNDLIILPWNELDIVERMIKARAHEIAAVILEPIMANCGVIMPQPGYLEGLRRITQEHGVVLIFDEVITGFRASLQGAQGYFGVVPDLTIFAKAVGGGYPIAGYAGRKDIMEPVAQGKVVHAGTLNGNALVVAAALATLQELAKNKGAVYESIRQRGQKLMAGLEKIAQNSGVPMIINGVGTFFGAVFGTEPLANYRSTLLLDRSRAQKFAAEMLLRGVFLFPKGRGLWYLSAAHTDEDVDVTLATAEEVIPLLK